MGSPLLSIEGLGVQFKTKWGILKAANDVSLVVQKGEVYGLVGESGSGKSMTALSILRLLPRAARVVSGSIWFKGTDILKLGKEEMRNLRGKDISMIFQDPQASFDPVFTIGSQIGEAITIHYKSASAERNKHVTNLLSRVGIPEPEIRRDQYPHQFSGGMKQRCMSAMAIANNPSLLIADEPTTALDVTIQAQILEIIKELTSNLGTAVILISHNLGLVARYVDRMAVMYAGYIVESGPAIEIYHRPRHPYTIGLLACVPRLDQPRKERLVPIEGQPPDLTDLPEGCSFCPRCSRRLKQCLYEKPELRPVGADHLVACFDVGLPKNSG
jgi:oligopeptide/dipeptide ABC transporter ATP-binding protein